MDLTELKKQKKEKHLTLQEISDLSGIPKRTVDDIFSGKTKNPKVDTIDAIKTAMGLVNHTPTWTEQERALGVGNHPMYLSADEWEWLELGSELLRVKGEDYLKTVKAMLEAVIKAG